LVILLPAWGGAALAEPPPPVQVRVQIEEAVCSEAALRRAPSGERLLSERVVVGKPAGAIRSLVRVESERGRAAFTGRFQATTLDGVPFTLRSGPGTGGLTGSLRPKVLADRIEATVDFTDSPEPTASRVKESLTLSASEEAIVSFSPRAGRVGLLLCRLKRLP
jgi:hypothetical protein